MKGGSFFRIDGDRFRLVDGRLTIWRFIPGLGTSWSMINSCDNLQDAIKCAINMKKRDSDATRPRVSNPICNACGALCRR